MLKSSLIKLHAAATIFVVRDRCSAQEIADLLNMKRNGVYHLAKQPEWDAALDDLQYTGNRNFTTKKRGRTKLRDTRPKLIAKAKKIYLKERRAGKKHSRAVTAILSFPYMGRDRRTINAWAEEFEWEKDI